MQSRDEKATQLIDKTVFSTSIRAWVQGSKPETVYRVDLRELTCECADYVYRGGLCKHLLAAQMKAVSA